MISNNSYLATNPDIIRIQSVKTEQDDNLYFIGKRAVVWGDDRLRARPRQVYSRILSLKEVHEDCVKTAVNDSYCCGDCAQNLLRYGKIHYHDVEKAREESTLEVAATPSGSPSGIFLVIAGVYSISFAVLAGIVYTKL